MLRCTGSSRRSGRVCSGFYDRRSTQVYAGWPDNRRLIAYRHRSYSWRAKHLSQAKGGATAADRRPSHNEPSGGQMSLLSMLDREHTVAGPGIQPLAFLRPRSRPSLHRSACLQRLQSSNDEADRHHQGRARRFHHSGTWLDLQHRHRHAWPLGGRARPLGRGRARRAMLTAACCFGGGFLIAALGVSLHSIWIIYFGYGFVGGIGLGTRYISPFST